MKYLLKRLLYSILFLFFLYNTIPYVLLMFDMMGYLNTNNDYIAYVNTPSHPETEQYIKELNHRGFGELYPKSGLRPIIIVERDLNKIERSKVLENGDNNPYNILGMTFPVPLTCLIVMDTYLTKDQYKQVLFHEILHCSLIEHSDEITDLMYHSSSIFTDINTVDKYLEDLVNRRK